MLRRSSGVAGAVMGSLVFMALAGYCLALLAGGLWLVFLRSADRANQLSWEEREWLEDILKNGNGGTAMPQDAVEMRQA